MRDQQGPRHWQDFRLAGWLCLGLAIVKLTLESHWSWWRVLLPLWTMLGHNVLYIAVGFVWLYFVDDGDATVNEEAPYGYQWAGCFVSSYFSIMCWGGWKAGQRLSGAGSDLADGSSYCSLLVSLSCASFCTGPPPSVPPLVNLEHLNSSLLTSFEFSVPTKIKGTFAGGSADEIRVVVAGQTLTFKTANIEAVKFDSGPASAETQAFTQNNPGLAAPVPSQAGTTIPANTPVVVRLIDSADSSHDSLGKEYRASLDEPLVNQSGKIVAPRGSDVLIVLTNRQDSGHFAGKTELRLALRSLTIQGKRYDVSSTDVVEASSSRTARSDKTIGGLAAAGAVIGAIAGGGKGAAIGAGSGATLGTLGEVFKSGQRVRVPSETRLTFRLQQPLLVN
jgi:hypothetical protein